jgi:cell division protein FtsB
MIGAALNRVEELRQENNRLVAEIERLRAALEKIAGPTWVHSDEVYVTLESLQLIAREALQ